MSKPPPEALPGCTKLLPGLGCQINALFFVAFKHVVQLLCCAFIYDDGIFLVVKAHASRIQIRAANGTEFSVYHHNLRVMEPWLIEPNISSLLHQFMSVVEGTVWREWDITLGREHDVNLDTSLNGTFNGFADRWNQSCRWSLLFLL